MSQEIMLKKKCVVSEELEKIGWGKYQKKLFIACFCSLSLTMLWTECTALLTYQIEASQIEKTFLIVSLNTGTFIGCLLLPWLLSHFGRLKVFRIDIALICVGGALCSLASHFIYPGLFLAGLGVGGDMSITYTVFMEAIPKSKLKYLTVLNAAWSAGAAMSAFLALCIELIGTYEIKQWRVLVWISLVLSFYIVYQRIYLLESPMYLYTISDQRVYDVLQEIANINGNSLYRPEFELGVIEECEESHSSSTIFSKDHRKTTFILSLIYSSSCFAYYSLLFFTPVLIPSSTLVMDYIVIISQQLLGIPGSFIASHFIDSKLGRKGIQVLGFALAGINTFICAVLPNGFIMLFFSAITFSSMMGALSALYTHIQELYPTMLRGNASGWLTSLGFGTAIVMPMIINGLNARYGIEYSLLVIGISFLISAAFVFFLKETQVSNKAESKKIGYN